jgi:uncharacterized protein YqeY
MSDAIEEIRRQAALGSSHFTHNAVRALLAEIDALRARAERAEASDAESIAMYRRARERADAAEKERDEARDELVIAKRVVCGLNDACLALQKVRDAAERVVEEHEGNWIADGTYLGDKIDALRSALTAARGEEKEHGV